MSRRRKKSGRGFAIAILTMAVMIIILLIAIGVLLIRRNTGNPLAQATVSTAEDTDASGSTGQRAYITVSKQALASVSGKQFASFYEKSVAGKDYTRFTILCDDGTGIAFFPTPQTAADGTSVIASYGYINASGEVTESFGQILQKSGTCQYQAQ